MDSAEIKHIQDTWKLVAATPTDSGAAILIAFFTKYPSNIKKFPNFEGIPLDELKTSPRFRAHAGRIIRVFDESVKALEGDEALGKLQTIWSEIAISHFKRQIEKQSFNELKEIILETLTSACSMNDDQIAAWTKVLDAIYDIVFQTLDKLKAGQ